MEPSQSDQAVADIGGLAIGIGTAIVIIAIMVIVIGSTTQNMATGGCTAFYTNTSFNSSTTNLTCTGVGNYSAVLFDLEGYAQTSMGMVMLAVLVGSAMFIVWLVGGGGR